MPEARRPAPSRAIPGTSRPVRGSSPADVAAGAEVVVLGVVEVVDPVEVGGVPLVDDTGGWLLSGGPPVWLLDDCFCVVELDVLLWLFVVVEPLPTGSVY